MSGKINKYVRVRFGSIWFSSVPKIRTENGIESI